MPVMETALANPSARRIAVAGSWHPLTGFHRNVDGTPPMDCGLNTCTGPVRDRTPLVNSNHVVLGGGRHRRARVIQHDPRQQLGLAGPGRCHDQGVLFDRDAQAMQVVGTPDDQRVLVRTEQPPPGRQ